MENDEKWYYVEYETGYLQDEFYASSPAEAEQMAINEVFTFGVEIEVQEMED